MKFRYVLTIATVIQLAFICVPSPMAWADEPNLIEHPSLNFRFSAPGGWETHPRPEDELIHEVFNRDSGIHVMLWYTATQQGAQRYLSKMADMKDVVVDGREPQGRLIDGREAWVYNVSTEIRGEAVHTLLAAINGGMDSLLPDHKAIYIIQIWCPGIAHPWLGAQMLAILASVSIGEVD